MLSRFSRARFRYLVPVLESIDDKLKGRFNIKQALIYQIKDLYTEKDFFNRMQRNDFHYENRR